MQKILACLLPYIVGEPINCLLNWVFDLNLRHFPTRFIIIPYI